MLSIAMQHLNYFTLRALALALQKRLAGGRVLQAFSQEKDVLTLLLKGEERAFYLQAACGPPLAWIAPLSRVRRARKNVADVLAPIVNRTIVQVGILPLERTIWFELGPEEDVGAGWLLFKMYGTRSNVLYVQGETLGDTFRHRLEAPALFVFPAYLHEAAKGHPHAWVTLLKTEKQFLANAQASLPAHPEVEAIRKLLPMLDKPLAQDIFDRLQTGLALPGALAPLLTLPARDEWYLMRSKGKTYFLLTPSASAQKIEGIFDALERFVGIEARGKAYQGQREQVEARLQAAIEKATGAFASQQKSLAHQTEERDPEELGHLLLANIDKVESGADSVRVDDYYQEGSRINIKLDPALSAQDNAQRYYAQHRDWLGKQEATRQQLAQSQQKLARLVEAQNVWATVTNLKSLKKFLETYPELAPEAGTQASEPLLPYREVAFEGYIVRVGRNAKANDQLTFRHSRKADWWLHAQNETGTHVVITSKGLVKPPNSVLEYAASLAAGYSGGQHSSLVPVVLTQVKYLRKRKGMTAGKVEFGAHETLIVPPSRLS
jgi:predicted ribosome quality control (RQC) complex YloA/Tae2 family protein